MPKHTPHFLLQHLLPPFWGTNSIFVQHIVRVCRLYYGVDMLCVPRENIDPVHLPESLTLERQ
jgi:hypothetical protein